MSQYRSRRTCTAVQWFPGVEIPGVRELTADECRGLGWPCASASLDLRPGVRIVRPSDWIVTHKDGGQTVTADPWFRSEWEPT